MKRKTVIAVISVLLSLTLLLCAVPLIAKYISGKGEQSEITSEKFYFTSNYLNADETPPKYEIYGNSVTFQVRNFVDSLRINQSDISYSVSADGGSLDKTGGTLTGGASRYDSITLEYIFADDEERKEITVTVASTDTYTNELTAKFTLIKPYALGYEIKDVAGRDYAELYIYTGDASQSVTLLWDNAKTLIDETNDYVFSHVQNQTSPEKSTVAIGNIAAYTTVKIVFFKNDISENYTHGLTKSDGTITIP